MKIIFIITLCFLVCCQRHAFVHMPMAMPGDTISVKKVMIIERVWNKRKNRPQVIGSYAIRCDYIIKLDSVKYSINGKLYMLSGYDSTNIRSFEPLTTK
ncbi:MAG TPA: hypothetical protein VG847_03400 [Chitinophagaceae bacterium]|nr:hypothetical protein [Chitinophagaceae bacterium]